MSYCKRVLSFAGGARPDFSFVAAPPISRSSTSHSIRSTAGLIGPPCALRPSHRRGHSNGRELEIHALNNPLYAPRGEPGARLAGARRATPIPCCRNRKSPLTNVGPGGNDNFLNMRTFIVHLIGAKGAFPFTQDILSKYADFQWAAPNHWRLRGEFGGASGNAALMGLSLA